jgi:hypothetical protein
MDYSNDRLKEFFSRQLQSWSLAACNYKDLAGCRERELIVGGFPVKVSLNPARIKSTTANVSTAVIRERKCFLCSANRPVEQMAFEEFQDDDFLFLVNPYPICYPHFTIVSKAHVPQDMMPWRSMVRAAYTMPKLTFFYNGAKAGASAPDHLHYQAVAKTELPLIAEVEDKLTVSNEILTSKSIGINYPALFYCYRGDIAGFQAYAETEEGSALLRNPLMNAFVWIGENGELYLIIFPREAHRPQCYFATDEEEHYMISPGALDVAGKIITIRENDFTRISETILTQIFEETCLQ